MSISIKKEAQNLLVTMKMLRWYYPTTRRAKERNKNLAKTEVDRMEREQMESSYMVARV